MLVHHKGGQINFIFLFFLRGGGGGGGGGRGVGLGGLGGVRVDVN